MYYAEDHFSALRSDRLRTDALLRFVQAINDYAIPTLVMYDVNSWSCKSFGKHTIQIAKQVVYGCSLRNAV